MKTFTPLGFILAGCLRICAAQLPETAGAPTNTLAIYLVADTVPAKSIIEGTALPTGFQIKNPPILSDSDFVSWNVTNHSIVITPNAAKRIVGICRHRERPFVLMAKGEPIYLGIFGTLLSSSSAAVPVILTDQVLDECFLGEVPIEVRHMLSKGDQDVTKHLLALTNATTNVTLKIDRGYPPPGGFGRGTNRRDDKRIAEAVETLVQARRLAAGQSSKP